MRSEGSNMLSPSLVSDGPPRASGRDVLEWETTAPPLGAVKGGNGRAGAARSEARTRALEWPLTGEAGRWGRAKRKGPQWRAERHTDTRLECEKRQTWVQIKGTRSIQALCPAEACAVSWPRPRMNRREASWASSWGQ